MTSRHDLAIIGLCAMGSSVAFHLARRGARVVGFDRFTPPHDRGSSHGQSRIIREAYYEDPLYVPLVQRSYALWQELEAETGETLLRRTGALLIGPVDGMLVSGSRESAERHGLEYEIRSAAEIVRRHPVLRVNDRLVGLWEPRAGALLPEKCVEAQLRQARKNGADLHFAEPVLRWSAGNGGFELSTEKGSYRASKLVITAGPWTNRVVGDPGLPLTVERQVQYWFRPVTLAEEFDPARLPIFAWEYRPGKLFYGFPDLGDGVKIALHHQGRNTDADAVDRRVGREEVETIRRILREHIPDLVGPLLRSSVCLYTNTPDLHFLLDFHPEHPGVLIASPCSGHGFKFAQVIGEICADLLLEGKTNFDLSPFRMDRLRPGKP